MSVERIKKIRIKSKRGRPSLVDILRTLDEEVDLLHTHLGGLPRAVEADHILRQIWLDDVHNSTAIEGNTMTRAQVEALVEKRQPSASLVETLEVEGYARAADWVYRCASDYESVPTSVVSEAHKFAVDLAWKIQPPVTRDLPGVWRKTGVTVGSVRVSSPATIPADLDEWSTSTKDRKSVHPLIRAAIHHAWFERIHPFVDGNGRVGRLLLNFMLIQDGYPPAVILASSRARYLRALKLADAGNPHRLAEVIARAVRHTLSRFLIPNLAGEVRLVPLSALAAHSPYSAGYLRLLISRGQLRAILDGRLWLSSRAWLASYMKSRDPRGVKTKRARREARVT